MMLFRCKMSGIIGLATGITTLIVLVSPSFSAQSISRMEGQQEEKVLSKNQQARLIVDGRKLATKRCASCHSIKTTGQSANSAAPPFRSFSDKWPLDSLEESLAEGIVTGHEAMPETIFTPEEITAFLEFLSSIQSKTR